VCVRAAEARERSRFADGAACVQCYAAMNKHLRENSAFFEQLASTLEASTGSQRTAMAEEVRRKIRARKQVRARVRVRVRAGRATDARAFAWRQFVTALEAKFDRVHRVLGELKQQLKAAKSLAPTS
jgi:hypothetical protein